MEHPKQRSVAPAEPVPSRLLRSWTRCSSSGLGHAGENRLRKGQPDRSENLLFAVSQPFEAVEKRLLATVTRA